MKAEILITGQEIIAGDVVDTNSTLIAQALTGIGVQVVRHHSVGDDMQRLVDQIGAISRRASIAVVTGGLGPTSDDITAEAAAAAAAVELVLDPASLAAVETYFKVRKRPMSASNKKQAMLPAGAECLRNPIGTAPGFHLKIGECSFFFMPGVPSEMQRMLADRVIPKIMEIVGHHEPVNLAKVISLFGSAEAAVGEKLSDLAAEFPEIALGIRAKFPEIYVKLTVYGKDAAALNQRIAMAADWVVDRMGDHVISPDGKSMETVVGERLAAKNATLAVAESCTGGLISHLLTNVPGSSNYFLFGGVTYSNEAKRSVLGVALETLEKYGAVHEETAIEMAVGAKQASGSSYGLATSGIAGPSGGTADKPVGTVCIGLATPNNVNGYRFFFPFNRRSRNKKIFAMTALDLLRKELLKPISKAI